jgi:hypothetical protein
MSRKVTGLVGTVAAVVMCDASMAATQAQPNPGNALRVESYADLLEPIPNAAALLRAVDREQDTQAPRVQLAYYYHHHHHHHRYWRGWYAEPYYHHHHHHHGYWRWRHHHHHHHHHRYYRDWDDR